MASPTVFLYGRFWFDSGYNFVTCCGERLDSESGIGGAVGGRRKLDGGYTPTETHKFGKEGDCRLAYVKDYTILSMLDRHGGDIRGGNHDTFVITASLTWPEALGLCRAAFPHIFARLGLTPIRLREVRVELD